jgi:hypothetical protein
MLVLSKSIGSIIDRIEYVHDYISIYFSDSSILHIYNRIDLSSSLIATYVGLTLLSIEASEKSSSFKSVLLIFSKNQWIRIGLCDNDYSTPESYIYRSPDMITYIGS